MREQAVIAERPKRNLLLVLALLGAAMLPVDATWALQETSGDPTGQTEPAASPEALERFEYTRVVMGVKARIVLYAESEEGAQDEAAAAFERLEEIEQALSDYRRESEVNRLCEREAGEPVEVSDDLFRVLAMSARVAEASGGAFDCTVGPIVRLWREARRSGTAPAPDDLEAARAVVGHELVELDEDARTATLARDGMQLDFGGIAKGYAASRAVEWLAKRGHARALVDIGGDLALGAPPPGEPGWRVRIATGLGGDRTLTLSDVAVATSSGEVQFVEIDGVKYSHIIDPRTGAPLTAPIGVSVVAKDGAIADALASAVSVLGGNKGTDLVIEFEDAEALVVEMQPLGRTEWTTRGFPVE